MIPRQIRVGCKRASTRRAVRPGFNEEKQNFGRNICRRYRTFREPDNAASTVQQSGARRRCDSASCVDAITYCFWSLSSMSVVCIMSATNSAYLSVRGILLMAAAELDRLGHEVGDPGAD
jgi:hypothetical protein